KKSDTKDREKVERADDSGQANTPNQQQSTSTPTNFDESGQPLKDEQKKQTPLGADDVI
ncbi:unnamed protein product, partial [Rotaria magnacalcarata]